MEDDARPTPALIDSIYDGEYKEILKLVNILGMLCFGVTKNRYTKRI